LLKGSAPSPELFADAAEYCSNLEADGSIHGSSDFKRSMAAALVRRALIQASERSQAEASTA
jgi:CO/xanthine dehydrogenase FAD-binding subunit